MYFDVLEIVKNVYKDKDENSSFNDVFLPYVDENSEYSYCICSECIFKEYYQKNELCVNKFIVAIFDISTIFSFDVSIRFSLYILSEAKPSFIKIGIYNKNYKLKQKEFLKKDFPIEFIEYCNLVNNWINYNSDIPKDSEYYEFNLIEESIFDKNILSAEKYKKNVLKTIELLKKEDTVPLNSLADVIIPKRIETKVGKSLTRECLKYPFCILKLNDAVNTDVQIKKGDIIIFGDIIYLFNECIKNIYINPFMQIIRPKSNITPEYLYVYLISDTARTIINYKTLGSVIKRISKKELENIPVIIPSNKAENYKEIFRKLYIHQKESTINELTSIISFLKNDEDNLESILLKEQLPKLNLIKKQKVRTLIVDDINELELCYKYKAYKATLILAGSILEAFLIDWLGDINQKDYFTEEYYVKDKYNPNKTKRADLIDYIDAIDELRRPKWMVEAKKAHEIRKKRNMVHAKLCMNQNQEINENTCKIVIDSLIEIISTRFSNIRTNKTIKMN